MARDVRINLSADADVDEIRKAIRELERLARSTDKAGDEAAQAGRKYDSLGDKVDNLEGRVEGLRKASDLLGDIFTGAILGGAFADIVLAGAEALRDFANASVEAYTAANPLTEQTLLYTAAQEKLAEQQNINAQLVGELLTPAYTALDLALIGVNKSVSEQIGLLTEYNDQGEETVVVTEEMAWNIIFVVTHMRALAPTTARATEALLGYVAAGWDVVRINEELVARSDEILLRSPQVQEALAEQAKAEAILQQRIEDRTAAQEAQDTAVSRALNWMTRAAEAQAGYEESTKAVEVQTISVGFAIDDMTAHYESVAAAEKEAAEEQDKVTRSFGAGTRAIDEQAEALARLERATASHFDTALKSEELEWNLSEALYESARAAGASTDALQVLALASGFPPEKIEEALRYAAIMAQIEELGRAIAEGEISVEEAVAQVQNFQNNTTNSNVTIGTINAGGQSVGSVVTELQSQGG